MIFINTQQLISLGVIGKKKKLMPRDVAGCVLSYIAKEAYSGYAPTMKTGGGSDQVVLSDRSKVRTSYNYTNLISNPTFENDLTSWITENVAMSISTSYNLYGSYKSAKQELSASTGAIYQDINAALGDKLYVRASCYIATAPSTGLSLSVRSNGITDTVITTFDRTKLNQWQSVSQIKTLTSTATAFRIYLGERSNNISGVWYFDGVIAINLTTLGLDTLSAEQCDELFPFTATSATTSRANDILLNNIAKTSLSGITKTPVLSNKGIGVSYANELVNSLFTSTANWNVSDATQSVSGGKNTIVANNVATIPRISQVTNIDCVSGKRIAIRFTFTVQSTSPGVNDCTYVLGRITATGMTAVSSVLKTTPIIGTEYKGTVIVMLTGGGSGKIAVGVGHGYAAIADNTKSMDVSEISAINLSDNTYIQALESQLGRQLTPEECDRLFPFTATTNSVVVDTPYSLALDGTDDYGSMDASPSLDITTGEFALCATFMVRVGSNAGYMICKNSSLSNDQQYALLYDATNKQTVLYLNGGGKSISGVNSVLENTWYNLIFYRNSIGVISAYLNKSLIKTDVYVDVLVSQPNMRVGARSTNAGGTTHSAFFKGELPILTAYNAPTLNIDKIIKAQSNVSKEYIPFA